MLFVWIPVNTFFHVEPFFLEFYKIITAIKCGQNNKSPGTVGKYFLTVLQLFISIIYYSFTTDPMKAGDVPKFLIMNLAKPKIISRS